MSARYSFVIFNQSCSRMDLELCAEIARELGPTLLHTGSNFDGEERGGLTIIKAPAYNNSSYYTRMKTWLAYVADAICVAAKLRGKPVVMVSSNPPFGPFLGYALHKLRGWPYMVRILDVYPDALIQNGLVGPRHLVPRVWGMLNRLVLGGAEYVITLGPVMAERVKKYLPSGKAVQIVPTWVDPSCIIPRAKDDNWFARAQGQTGKLTLLYTGNLGLTHDLSSLFLAAENLQGEADIHFLFIGGGARRGELAEVERRLHNFTLLPFQPEANIPYSLATGDVAIVALGRGTEGISMPSKTYFGMAAGSAILGISCGDNDLKRVIEEYQCGINVDTNDADGMRKAILRFRNDRDFLKRCQNNSRRAAEQTFSAAVCGRAYLTMLSDMRRAVS
jgi:glycosyltransferase involved in cell wall biosynthesis